MTGHIQIEGNEEQLRATINEIEQRSGQKSCPYFRYFPYFEKSWDIFFFVGGGIMYYTNAAINKIELSSYFGNKHNCLGNEH